MKRLFSYLSAKTYNLASLVLSWPGGSNEESFRDGSNDESQFTVLWSVTEKYSWVSHFSLSSLDN